MIRRREATAEKPAFELFTDFSRLESLAGEWGALVERSICNRAFSSPRWFLAWCRLEPAWRPHVVVARRGAAVAGVLPLVRSVDGGAAFFPGELSDYNDAVAARGDVEVSAGLLRTALGTCARITLSYVRTDSNLALALGVLEPSRAPGSLLSTEGSLVCSYVDLARGYEAYLASRKSKFRTNLRRAWRRAGETGLSVRELEPESFAPKQLPAAFLELHCSRFPRTCFDAPRERSFAETVLPGLFADRSLRVFAVFDGGRMIGISLCVVGDRSLGIWNGGFLVESRRHAPGKLLIDAEIRQACTEGLEELDFMRGNEDYKADWSTGSRRIGRLQPPAGHILRQLLDCRR